MAQTAVEWFIEQLEEKGYLTEISEIRLVEINIDTSEYLDLKRQAKAMEKEQIIDADLNGTIRTAKGANSDVSVRRVKELGEQYYNETYKNGL